MKLNHTAIKIINKYKSLLKQNDFNEFYKKAMAETSFYTDIGRLTDFFIIECGINVFNYLDELPEGMFANSELEKIIIPNKYERLPEACFLYSKATEIILPETIEKIGDYAFLSCSDLEKMSLPNNIEVIPSNCFEDCSKLKEIELPKNLKEIKHYAFFDCKSLEKLTIPEGVTYIGEKLFEGCFKLEKIEVSEYTIDNINISTLYTHELITPENATENIIIYD